MTARGYHKHKNPDGRAREHSIPRWLQRVLQVSDVVFHSTTIGPDADVIVKPGVPMPTLRVRKPTRKMVMEADVNGRVCGRRCNSSGGWMNRLEDRTRPLLKALIAGERKIETLSNTEGRDLAKWVLKTAFLVDNSAGAKENVNVQHVRDLMEDRLPTGIALFGRWDELNSPVDLAAKISREVNAFDHRVEADAFHETSYKASFMFGRLYLTLVYWSGGNVDWSYAIRPGVHSPIWPASCRISPVEWKVRFGPEYDSTPRPPGSSTINEFHLALGVSAANPWRPFLRRVLTPSGERWMAEHEISYCVALNSTLTAHGFFKVCPCFCGSELPLQDCHPYPLG